MDLLVYEKAYARIAERLAEDAPSARPIVMADDGSLNRDGRAIPRDRAKPEIAWCAPRGYCRNVHG